MSDWRDNALCKGQANKGNTIWFSFNPIDKRNAVSWCRECPVPEECAREARELGAHGEVRGAMFWRNGEPEEVL